MKILHISPESIETNEILGGRGIFLKEIIYLQEKEHDVKLLSWGDGTDKRVVSIDKTFYAPTPKEYIGIYKAMNMKFLAKATELMLTWKPDVIHLHDADAFESVEQLKKIFNIPLVYTVHLSAGYMIRAGLNRTTLQTYLYYNEQRATQLADHIHVCSEGYKERFYRGGDIQKDFKNGIWAWYWTDKPISVIRNGVNPKHLGEKGTGVTKKYKNIFFAGRFSAGKGIETICEIIPNMKDCRFFFAGQFNGAEKDKKEYPTTKILMEMANKYPDRVVLLGQLRPHAMIGHWGKQMDVWLSPSWHCPFELVGLEAMACGVPTILTNIGAYLEYGKDGENCLMVEPKNAKQLKDTIYQILGDDVLKSKLIEGGKKTVAEHTWEKTVEDLNEIYNEVTNG